MKKIYIYLSLIMLIFTGVSAAPMVATQDGQASGGYNINIPEVAKEYVEEKDLVEVFCYEAMFRGGEAIATLEAVAEALDESLAEMQEYLGIVIDTSLYSDPAQSLNAQMEQICNTPTLAQAQAATDQFKSTADQYKSDMKANLETNLRDQIENQIKAEKDQIRARFEKKLRSETDELVEEKKKYYEAQIRAEAEQEKNRIQAKLQKEIEAELKAEYGGQEDVDVNQLLKIGKERGMARGAVEGKKAEERLRVKYEKIAEEEEVKLRAQMEEKTKEKEKEIRELYSDLSGLGELINQIKQEKIESEWSEYQKKAQDARLAIIKKVISKQFEIARKYIEEQRENIEQAQAEGVDRQYNIPTVDALLQMIERDENEVLAYFAQGNYSNELIQEIKTKFKEKWENLRKKLEEAKVKAPAEVIRITEKKTDWSKLTGRLNSNLSHMRNVQNNYAKKINWCQQNPTVTSDKKRAGDCAQCRLINKEYKDWSEVCGQIETQINKALPLIKKIQDYKQTPPTLEIALEFKDELQSVLNELRNLETLYKQSYITYQDQMKIEQNNCIK
jgi:hypothetical protein